jgi:hypothetical protein
MPDNLEGLTTDYSFKCWVNKLPAWNDSNLYTEEHTRKALSK